jgi:hypothetical protein
MLRAGNGTHRRSTIRQWLDALHGGIQQIIFRLLPVLYVLGVMLMLFSITYLMPIVASVITADGTWIDFVDAMIASF